MKRQHKIRWQFAGVVLLGLICGLIAYPQAIKFFPAGYNLLNQLQVNEGLDLQGGIHLEYAADVSNIEGDKVEEALAAAEAVIERRVNAFGVGEPLVQRSKAGSEERIIVELPGIKDVEQAKAMIKETPFLEFKETVEEKKEPVSQETIDQANAASKAQAESVYARARAGEDFAALAKEFGQDGTAENGGDLDFAAKGQFVKAFEDALFNPDFKNGEVYASLVESEFGWHIIKKTEERGEGDEKEVRSSHILFLKRSLEQENTPLISYQSTGLSGKHLKDAYVDYQTQGLGSPQIALQFDDEGTQLFADITKRNIEKPVAIFLDGEIISAPTIQQEIVGGQAVITGNFTLPEANELVRRLNEGALPVPITLVGQQSVDASLGETALKESLLAGLVGLGAVAVFMLVFYRFMGAVAVVALLIYTAMLLTLFKLSVLTPFPITVTLSGIAGFILSIGIAVDANILIAERTREEMAFGKGVHKSLKEGFRRAWPSIIDGHVAALITTFILIGFGTGFVKGFAVILGLGVLLSLFTAVVLVRVITFYFAGDWMERYPHILVSPKKPVKSSKA